MEEQLNHKTDESDELAFQMGKTSKVLREAITDKIKNELLNQNMTQELIDKINNEYNFYYRKSDVKLNFSGNSNIIYKDGQINYLHFKYAIAPDTYNMAPIDERQLSDTVSYELKPKDAKKDNNAGGGGKRNKKSVRKSRRRRARGGKSRRTKPKK